MDIALYISDLLRDYDEISLPGVGVFYKKKFPASFDEQRGLFTPPSQQIGFREADPDQSVLISYVCGIKNISEASARYFINKFTDSIKQSLAATGRADLEPLGQLRSGAHGLELHQDKGMNSPEFGLPVLQDPAFARLQKEAPADGTEADDEAPVYEEKSSGSFWQAVLIVLVFLGSAVAAYYYYPNLFGEKKQSQTQASTATPAVPADTITKDTTDTAHTPAAAAEAGTTAVQDSQPAGEDTLKAASVLPSYEIITASLAFRTEAETEVKRLQGKGIKAKIIEDTRKPKFKVSIASFTNYEQANLEKRKIQQSINKEAWILTVNDKAK